jgi:hypothetical protein
MGTLTHPEPTIYDTRQHTTLPKLSRSVLRAAIVLIKFLLANLLAITTLPLLLLSLNPAVPADLSLSLLFIDLGFGLLFCAWCARCWR